MKTLKLYFVDFWPNFNIANNFFTKILRKNYSLELNRDNPDYLFYSVFGDSHLKYKNCIKIFYTGENDVPDFNIADYAIGFQFITFEDRYIRFPLYLLDHYGWEYLTPLEHKQIDNELANRKFCNFVYSNGNNVDPIRDFFFTELSKYKKIDSGGRYRNNIGAPVADKKDFIKNYKFTIAFENSSSNGYTTEKIIEPMIVNSLPIYWGNPMISSDFNENSFIHVKDKESIAQTIQQIIELDNSDDLYLQKLSKPWFISSHIKEYWEEKITSFLYNIFDKKKEEAFRCPQYGRAKILLRDQKRMVFIKRNFFFKKFYGLLDNIQNHNN